MTTKNKTINPDHEAAMEMARALDRNGDVIPDAMAIIRDDCINLARAYLEQSAELVCPCCLADPAFKGPCICKGTGKVSVGEQTLREMLVNERTRETGAVAHNHFNGCCCWLCKPDNYHPAPAQEEMVSEPTPEPREAVAYMVEHPNHLSPIFLLANEANNWGPRAKVTPLYTHPALRQPDGVTEEQLVLACSAYNAHSRHTRLADPEAMRAALAVGRE